MRKKTGHFELRTNAIAKNVLVDDKGRAKGVAYVDRNTRQEVEVYGKTVVLAASCLETAKIMLNSKSRHWPTGIANSRGELWAQSLRSSLRDVSLWLFAETAGTTESADNVSASTVV